MIPKLRFDFPKTLTLTEVEAAEPKIRALAASLAADRGCELRGACFFYALATNAILGLPIAGGSMLYQIEKDTGANMTHFSYTFEPEKAQAYIAMGQLPEIHFWNVTPRNDVLDYSTIHLPEQIAQIVGKNIEPCYAPHNFYFGAPKKGNSQYPQILYEFNPLSLKIFRFLYKNLA